MRPVCQDFIYDEKLTAAMFWNLIYVEG